VEIVALVKSRDLFDTPQVTYMEFPHIMHSWLARLWFEYRSAKCISKRLKPRLWLSLHETTPNVEAETRAVYCHNVSEFYRITPAEFMLDWRFGMFTLFFRLIHRINIRKNKFVVVQARVDPRNLQNKIRNQCGRSRPAVGWRLGCGTACDSPAGSFNPAHILGEKES
jgi:hypothetical protein